MNTASRIPIVEKNYNIHQYAGGKFHHDSSPFRPKIYYVHDLLCSYCYGFIPTMRTFIEKYALDFEIVFVNCGLFIGRNRKPIQQIFSGDSRKGYAQVMEITGVSIASVYFDKLIDQENYIVNSEKVAAALQVYKEEISANPFDLIEFQKVFQDLLYQEALPPNEAIFYQTLAQSLDLHADFLLSRMELPTITERINQDFTQVRKVFRNKKLPSLYLEKEPLIYTNMISGYHKMEAIEDALNKEMQA